MQKDCTASPTEHGNLACRIKSRSSDYKDCSGSLVSTEKTAQAVMQDQEDYTEECKDHSGIVESYSHEQVTWQSGLATLVARALCT